MIKIGVVSGKGGVGKSTIAVSMAIALVKKGFKVGLVDIDITGPNIHDLLGKSELKITSDDKFIPTESMGVKYISIGEIASDGLPILWDSKDVKSAAKQLMERTEWGNLDFLIFDFPPGFGPEVIEMLPLMDYVLIVTIPSVLSKSKVDRIVEACREYQVKILGVVMNMSYLICPFCNTKYRIFSEDHSFEELGIPTIAEFPFCNTKYINEFPVESFIKALNNPIILKKKRSLKRKLLKLLLKVR
ncbi:MAG: P-loop NTPase [Candidatus Methanomethylicia archaeon]